jgi:hypothetical protein
MVQHQKAYERVKHLSDGNVRLLDDLTDDVEHKVGAVISLHQELDLIRQQNVLQYPKASKVS